MQKTFAGELKFLKIFLFVVFLFAYQGATTVTALPPLLGVFFTYLIYLNLRREKRLLVNEYELYFCIFYLIFIEQTHGFALFSSLLGCIFFYYFMFDYLSVTLKSRILLIGSFTIYAYLFTFAASLLLGYAGDFQTPGFGYEMAIYAAIEAVIAIILFKERFA